jgi:hypothetical protein
MEGSLTPYAVANPDDTLGLPSLVYSIRFTHLRALGGYSLNVAFSRYIGTAKHVFPV